MEADGSLPHSQQLATCSYSALSRPISRNLCRSEAVFLSVTCLMFYGEEFLAYRRTPQAGGSPTDGCPRRLFLFIFSYPSYLEAMSSITSMNMDLLFLVISCKLKILHHFENLSPNFFVVGIYSSGVFDTK